ncbi:MAG: DNA recombination protein RmuC [Bacteroidaceae bacterium]|nr:DNA recombination protein RmuC [Bacteroidaceae bacterium]
MRGKLNVVKTILDERTSEGIEYQRTLREREQTLTAETEARQQLAVRVEVLTTQLADQQQHSREALQAREEAAAEAIATKEQAARDAMAAQEQRHSEALKAQQERFDETIARISAQMKDATNEMLRQRQKEFSEASGQSLGVIVNPLKENIEELKRTLAENKNQQSADSGAIKTIIQQMMQASEEARRSTDELTRVFRKSNNVQGLWGETVLDELLESQGLTRGVHYDVQPTIRDAAGSAVISDEGSRMRPDVILHLDQRRDVIIDSKVSLAAYMDFVNAQDEGERQRSLAAHVNSIREQVKNLSVKDYSSYIQPPKVRMDYVIMFVPNTGALWTALGAQPDLWRWAMERNVYIADEQTLYAALRIINLTWTQIRQAENHEKVYALAGELMDRVGQFMKKYQAIGSSLAKAQQAYDEAERKLSPSGQSILQTCAKLQKLGAKQSDRNPLPQLIDIDDIEQLKNSN